MAKWADYLISAVHYSEGTNRKYISHLRVHPDGDSSVGTGSTWTKDQVVTAINSGSSFMTIYQGSDGKWKRGEDVRVITVNYRHYLRTDANHIEADNLGNLPEF